MYLENVEVLIVVAGDVKSFAMGSEGKHVVSDVASQGCSNTLCVDRHVQATFVVRNKIAVKTKQASTLGKERKILKSMTTPKC